MASLNENVDRPYHLFAILNARTFCDYFLQRTGSLITLFFPLIITIIITVTQPVQSSNHGHPNILDIVVESWLKSPCVLIFSCGICIFFSLSTDSYNY